MKLSNQPPRGTSDWPPDEYKIRKYIMDTWRKVCVSFGYEEYLTPILENAEIYRAKSGGDIGGKELMTFRDIKGRELAIRPEMTPSVTRLVSKIYAKAQKPIRLFSIANFVRNERPQKGRNREFWQLNYDCFGSAGGGADLEIIQMAIEIMLAFGAPEGSFKVFINDRNLIDAFLENILKIKKDQKQEAIRLLDKYAKLKPDELEANFQKLGLNGSQKEAIKIFMNTASQKELAKNFPALDASNFSSLKEVMDSLNSLGYEKWIEFRPNIIRGFDYYNGIVFEVFDQKEGNSRSLFGGGRYNRLGGIFGSQDIPAVGSAPGDETTKIFLENWGLLDKIKGQEQERYFLPILDSGLEIKALRLAKKLRQEGKIVEAGLAQQKIIKALEWANKKGIKKVVIFGPDELAKKVYKVKNMESGKEKIITNNQITRDKQYSSSKFDS